MRPAAAWPSLVIKESRALLWPWLACLGAMVVPAAAGDAGSWPLVCHIAGCLTIGALAMGHEYSGRTLALLLSQPVPRERIYLEKMFVLTAALASLVAVAYWALPAWRVDQNRLAHTWILLPALGGLCLTPWLTMATRNVLAGAVFTAAMPGGLLAVAGAWWQLTGRHGSWEDIQTTILWRVVPALCVVSAVAGWRLFMRLEATGDSDAASAVTLPARLGVGRATANSASAARRRPLVCLFAKELRLQQLSLALAGLYLLGWLAGWLVPLHVRQASPGVSAVYVLLIAVVAGTFASAEERQIGTLEWYALLPVSAPVQWAVKMAVVFGVVVLLGLGLAGGLETLATTVGYHNSPLWSGEPGLRLTRFALLATAGGLYVSSVSGSAARAMAVAIPALVAVASITSAFLVRVGFRIVGPGFLANDTWTYRALDWLLGVGFIVLVSRLAFVNHNTTDRPARRIFVQVAVIAAAGFAWILHLAIASILLHHGHVRIDRLLAR